VRRRSAWYWLATVPVVAELGLGGIWDIARLPFVRDLVTHLGYPSYFLVLLGIWKVLGAVALLVPGRALLKEWAYAGAFFTYTGAIASHLTTGYDVAEVGLLAAMTALTLLSWALRPPSRRLARGYAGGVSGDGPHALSLIVRNLMFTVVVPGPGEPGCPAESWRVRGAPPLRPLGAQPDLHRRARDRPGRGAAVPRWMPRPPRHG
jgi:hypothetical protein